MTTNLISPRHLKRLLETEDRVELIDVRTPAEFREVHIAGARNVPLELVDPQALISARKGSLNGPFYVVCHSGGRANKACQKFQSVGVENAVSVEGGMQAWSEAGLEVVRGKKAISLERQVRIAAGTLVLLGVGLAQLVHPYFVGLSAFVGVGLLFAGVTDTCGMGMLLARMPWNRVSPE